MNKKIENIGIILSGGSGTRFGTDMPKQYCMLNDKEVISYTVDAFRKSEMIDDIIVVVDENNVYQEHIQKKYGLKTVTGGNTRNWSFKNALTYIENNYPNCKKIIENNAACPMITKEIINEFMRLLDDYDYVNTAYEITDALGAYNGRIADRSEFYLIQAPDAYRFELINKYFDPNSKLCHPAHQLPMSCTEYKYFGYDRNIKITYPYDLKIAEIYMMENK